jgi:uncharacterized membrane protein
MMKQPKVGIFVEPAPVSFSRNVIGAIVLWLYCIYVSTFDGVLQDQKLTGNSARVMHWMYDRDQAY